MSERATTSRVCARVAPTSILAACLWTGSACSTIETQVARLPPLDLALAPGGDPIAAWPTSTPPEPVDAFHLPRPLMRRSWWMPQATYCIDPSGRVTSVEASSTRVPGQIERQVRGWSFAPWDGPPEARFCETTQMYDDEALLGRLSRATIMVFMMVVPPARALAADGELDVAPARLLPDTQGIPTAFWDVVPEDEPALLEPRFGELVLHLCIDDEGRPAKSGSWFETQVEGLSDTKAKRLVRRLWEQHPTGSWRFAPRIEAGVTAEDCEVEMRYAVWLIHDSLLAHHERLFEVLDIRGYGLPFHYASDELEPWAEPGPIVPLAGHRAASVVESSAWVPPYELAATMPSTLPTRTIRVQFCAPATGGHPSDIRVQHSDLQGPEHGLARLVGEGVARWRVEADEGGDGSPTCGEVEWQIGRRPWLGEP